MIGVSLMGGLGNQLFQYAAARVAAQRLGCKLIANYAPVGRRSVLRGMGRRTILAPIGEFPGVSQTSLGVALHAASEIIGQPHTNRVQSYFLPQTFIPAVLDVDGAPYGNEIYDNRFCDIQPGTLLWGYFQSPQYFQGFEKQVSDWFTPSPQRLATVAAQIETFPAPPDRMVAIHVRRGDYLTQRDVFSHPETGWALPPLYYEKAIAQLPVDIKLAIFSDDISYTRSLFAAFDPWISVDNDGISDIYLMASCRYMITANSSLSWWAGWLNRRSEKIVIAPKYHLGWRVKTWYFRDIKMPDWVYIDPN